MNIYLAGKMDSEKGRWRDSILGTDRARPKPPESRFPDGSYSRQVPRWHLPFDSEGYAQGWDETCIDTRISPWPVRSGIVLGRHDYCGPYRQQFTSEIDTKWSGEFHGSETFGQHGCMDWDDQQQVVAEALAAIRRADLVFAYVNDPEAWGTVAEIGYALALGKFVRLHVNDQEVFGEHEFWFVSGMCTPQGRYYDPSSCWDSDDYEGHEAGDGRGSIRHALKNAILDYTAWSEKGSVLVRAAPEPSDDLGARIAGEVFDSFRQISQWTSDPRVRGEADRMLRYLAGLAVGRKR